VPLLGDQVRDLGGPIVERAEDLGRLFAEQFGGLLRDGGGGGSVGRVFGEAGLHHTDQLVGDAGEVRLAVEYAKGDGLGVAGAEGVAACGREGEQRAPGEDVPRRPGGAVPVVLGAEPSRGPGQHAGAGDRGAVGDVGDAEVQHPRAVRGKDHVRGLQVAVDHPGGVHGRPRASGACGEQVQLDPGQRPMQRRMLRERQAGHIDGGQPRGLRLGISLQQRHQTRARNGGAAVVARVSVRLVSVRGAIQERRGP
jgi:hypothetical protein